ncbi:MAG: class I SAM-dependent methyltransferase [Anaerolineae bacterium]
MQDFYALFYQRVAHSAAHAEFCTRVFGINLCQHGFADEPQLDALINALNLSAGSTVLDLGCGNGMISEYLADRTGAEVTGLDYSLEAIAQARTRAQSDRLRFECGDINALKLPPAAYDAIVLIDSIYFSSNYARTIRELGAALRPGGRLAFLYSYGHEPWLPKEEFPAENLAPERTPLGAALTANGFTFSTQDFTQRDYDLAQRRKTVLTEMRAQFEAEDLMFVWDNRMGDANGVSSAVEDGLHRRYLYVCSLSSALD